MLTPKVNKKPAALSLGSVGMSRPQNNAEMERAKESNAIPARARLCMQYKEMMH